MSTVSKNKPADPSSSSNPPQPDAMSDDMVRTGIFAAVALGCLAITAVVYMSTRPAKIEEFGKVGQEYYPEFKDPTLATALDVYAVDAEKVVAQEFRVKKLKNGRWVIPSHHDYPADAEEQLAKTASSIIGIKRSAMVSRWEADHGKYGVVNPKKERLTPDEVDGVGKRITLLGESDDVLVDLIVGKEVEDTTGEYYVRHPEEDEVYIAELSIDLSTKFSDWIETELFEITESSVTEVGVSDYSIDELQGTITKSEKTLLARKTSSDPWELEGLDDATQEVDKDAVRDTVSAVADLEVSGVRPKQKGLTPDLKLDQKALSSQRDVQRLQQDLMTRGFILDQAEGAAEDQLNLLGRDGEMYVATNDGLVYELLFGRVFTGSQEELEIGLNKKNDDDTTPSKNDEDDEKKESKKEDGTKDEKDADDSKDSQEGDDDEDADEEKSDSNKPGRYVFVRVTFDPRHLGEELTKPTEPEEPAELKEAAKTEDDAADEKEESEEATDGEKKDEEDPLAKIRADYEAAKTKYEDDLRDYEERQKKIKEGAEKAEELNRRFAEWYYVIPGDDDEKLSVSRADFIKAKEEKTDPAGTPGDDLPAAPSIKLDGAGTSDSGPPPSVPADEKPSEDPMPEKKDDPQTPAPSNDSPPEPKPPEPKVDE